MEAKGPTLGRPWWLLPVGRVHPLWWGGIGVLLIWLDYLAGPSARFPVIYTIPVILAAWYSGWWPAVAMAVAVPVAHITFLMTLWLPGDSAGPVAASMFRGTIIILVALWFARLSEHERAMHHYLQRLEGLLPICSFCKSIRNKAGEWEPLERFISARSEAEFSHGLCPGCGKLHYPEIDLEHSHPEETVTRG